MSEILVFKTEKYSVLIFDKKRFFYTWVGKKHFESIRPLRVKNSLDDELESLYRGYLQDIKNPIWYREIPKGSPPHQTKKSFGWTIEITGRDGFVARSKIFLPRRVCDLKRGVAMREFLDSSEMEAMNTFRDFAPLTSRFI